jgi:hypothetical protein
MKYPSQHEAEAVLEALVAVQGVYLGGCAEANVAKILKAAEQELLKEFDCIFNHPDCSPWKIELKGKNNKRVVAWRRDWRGEAG